MAYELSANLNYVRLDFHCVRKPFHSLTREVDDVSLYRRYFQYL
jgi:hypothetical protein